MFYKVQLICSHPPHTCRCRHNIATEVTQEDLTTNLIKHNPSLLKYLGRPINRTETIKTAPNQPPIKEQQKDKPYKSIVEEKGLKFIIKDNPVSQDQFSKKQQQQIHIPKQQQKHSSQNQEDEIVPKDKVDRKPQSKNQKQLKKYHKDLKNQSRYLSNTAFRKYFDRQCFQNYGNQNITHKADGFVYHNYLKTHNINPHTGQNIPINQQTFYHALLSASPEKYAIRTQQLNLTHQQKQQQQQKHALQKKKIDMQKMLEDNLKHSKIQKKYENIKLKNNKGQGPKSNNRVSVVKSTQKIHGNYNNESKMRHVNHELNIQSRNAINSPKQALIRKQSQIRHTNPAQSIIIPQNLSKMQCGHKQIRSSNQCECCLNQMKGLILSMADSDPDLAQRMINSAKKATFYKNFALNNYQNAPMNPHNYRSDGKLNIYQA